MALPCPGTKGRLKGRDRAGLWGAGEKQAGVRKLHAKQAKAGVGLSILHGVDVAQVSAAAGTDHRWKGSR